MKYSGRPFEYGEKYGSRAVSRVPEAKSSSISDVTAFYYNGEGWISGNNFIAKWVQLSYNLLGD